jgi:4-amino-4-deoxychorismate lyase
MFPLLETICLSDGVFLNVALHQRRMDESAEKLFGMRLTFSLADVLRNLEAPQSGLFKCRVVYSHSDFRAEVAPYRIQPIRSLICREAGELRYPLKYADRRALDALFADRGSFDDVLILQNGWVTDTTYGNICLLRQGQWYTPEKPLLHGVMRQVLLEQGVVVTKAIPAAEIATYSHFKVINAMRNWTVEAAPVENICLA